MGAGPAGSSAAYHLASAGVDVLLLEKTAFPREKVCGDGLTPRAVKELIGMGIDTSPEAGWLHNKGLRIVGGGHHLQLPWPDLASFPPYGLVRTRYDFDEILARAAQKAGARLHERTNVTGPVLDRAGRITGVTARTTDEDGTRGHEQTLTAPLVVAADGNSSRLSLAMGLRRREDRPMGVAVRTYYTSPRHDDDWLESWLELWDRTTAASSRCCPGTAGSSASATARCNVGLGILNTSTAFQHVDYKDLLKRWLDQTPAEWGFRDENMTQPVRGAALPMGFNRQPHYARGLLLVGDAGGMVNPFNGEGIAYAMESGRIAADVVAQALARETPDARERALHRLPGHPQGRLRRLLHARPGAS